MGHDPPSAMMPQKVIIALTRVGYQHCGEGSKYYSNISSGNVAFYRPVH